MKQNGRLDSLPIMPNITKRPLAKNDLKKIWHYTYKQWGEKQADQYLYELEQGMITLAENPSLGVSCDSIRSGYRKFHINYHLIFYRNTISHVEIIRVLHVNMDYVRHLNLE